MKVFLVAFLAVAVMADSDPNLILAPNMYHTGVYGGRLIRPVVPVSYIQPTVQIMKQEEKKVEMKSLDEQKIQPYELKADEKFVKPISYINTPYINTPFINSPFINTPYTSYIKPQQVVVGPQVVQKNGEVESILHKRDADAEPWMLYNQGLYGVPAFRSAVVAQPAVYAANKATFYNPWTMDVTGKVTNDRVFANNYASKNTYAARAPGTNTVHLAKREADPLTVIANPMMYNHGLVNPIVSSPYMVNPYMVQPSVYFNPTVVSKTVAKPIAKNAPLGMEGVFDGKTVADDAWQFTPNYAGKGMVEHRTPGTIHRARRDADPLTIYRTGLYNTAYNYPTVVRSNLYNYPRTVVSGYRYGSPYYF